MGVVDVVVGARCLMVSSVVYVVCCTLLAVCKVWFVVVRCVVLFAVVFGRVSCVVWFVMLAVCFVRSVLFVMRCLLCVVCSVLFASCVFLCCVFSAV